MKDKCLGTAYSFGDKQKEEIGTSNVTVNIVELASDLASDSTRDEMLQSGEISSEDEMFSFDEDDPETSIYTDEAQEVFNRWYDYYYSAIEKCKI